MFLEFLAILWFIKIALYDIQTHLIKNLDLLVVGILLIPGNYENWYIGCLGLFIYILIYLVSRARIGYGDIKLSFICSLTLGTYNELSTALTATWILAGLFAMTQHRVSIPFAPFMIIGTYFTKIPLP